MLLKTVTRISFLWNNPSLFHFKCRPYHIRPRLQPI